MSLCCVRRNDIRECGGSSLGKNWTLGMAVYVVVRSVSTVRHWYSMPHIARKQTNEPLWKGMDIYAYQYIRITHFNLVNIWMRD